MATKTKTHTCERCGETLNPKTARMLELNSRTNIYSDPEVAPVEPAADSQGGFFFGVACARAVLKNGGRLVRIDARTRERERAERRDEHAARADARVFGALHTAKRSDGSTVRVSVPEDDRSLEAMHDAGRAILDAFGLDDMSGFTLEQVAALSKLRHAMKTTGGL